MKFFRFLSKLKPAKTQPKPTEIQILTAMWECVMAAKYTAPLDLEVR